jgi:two-component system response regulator GlrR
MTEKRKARVLLVDDDPKLLRLLAIRLEREGFEAICAGNAKESLVLLATSRPHIVLTDVRMEGMDGIALFDIIHDREPSLPVVILTAHGTIPDAVEATQRGVYAYMTKPFDGDELIRTLQRAIAHVRPRAAPGEEADIDTEWCSEIVTVSSRMQALLAQASRIASSEANVLLQGESGSGKELLARAIHRRSRRRNGPFVAINCMAIPEALFESEFFGHEKGAFTGASRRREGLLRSAQGGTMLLDEIADMPHSFQGKLLRVLQEREARPVGAEGLVPIDVRIISASHQDLLRLVEKREFREDLYYRLNGVTLEIPALAERQEDVPVLAEQFLAVARRSGEAAEVRGFSGEAMDLLVCASWPGNVRQLRNVVSQCALLSTSPLISPDLVRRALRAKTRKLMPLAEARDRFDFDYLVQLLQATGGNVTQAARLAERNRSEFYSLLKRHGLDPESFREAVSSPQDTSANVGDSST